MVEADQKVGQQGAEFGKLKKNIPDAHREEPNIVTSMNTQVQRDGLEIQKEVQSFGERRVILYVCLHRRTNM